MSPEISSGTDLSFREVCKLLKKEEPALIEAVDSLLGLSIVCTPIFLGDAATPALALLGPKNELTKVGKRVFEKLVSKREDDFVAHHHRMLVAYTMISFTSLFEALDRALPQRIRDKIAIQPNEKAFLARDAVESEGVDTIPVAAPHPVEDLGQQQHRLHVLHTRMANGFSEFVSKLACWEAFSDKEHATFRTALSKAPDLAAKMFEAQYFALCKTFPDFAIWGNLHRHEQTQKQIGSLAAHVGILAALARSSGSVIDIGFAKLHEAVLTLPTLFHIERAANVVEGLRRHYEARLNDPIIEDRYEARPGRPSLTFPKLKNAFIPQSYRVLRHSSETTRLESEDTWRVLRPQTDIGTFLISFLSSPYSFHAPLLILGHPGSGKSVLTKILSASLMSEQYTVIRVQLREVISDAPIAKQIEEQINLITQDTIGSWAQFIRQFKNAPPVVILDGYDELLQASGKVFAGYLSNVHEFQKNELEQGRPVRVIVTSRLTLIDKAHIPAETTIVRLLEFNQLQRDTWIAIWNQTNSAYFCESTPPVEPFSLPQQGDPEAKSIASLAEQPLLLLMLALYDSEDNKLRESKGLDRTVLYDDLLRRFVRRERAKRKEFRDLYEDERTREIDRDIARLGVTAIGMFNRRKLHTLTQELNEDLRFFNLEREIVVEDGRALSQAEMLLGSFFFVHKSKALEKGTTREPHLESAAFEFLHNTFGEFLVADFILRQALSETGSLRALKQDRNLRAMLERKLTDPGGFEKDWYACLIYTPLFTRPVVLEMMRESVEHALNKDGRVKSEFLEHLGEVVINQLRKLIRARALAPLLHGHVPAEGTQSPFPAYPLIGHMAIYGVNLIAMMAALCEQRYVFNEDDVGLGEDGARPWDQLTGLFRAWFSWENLSGLTSILSARRVGAIIEIEPKSSFKAATSRTRLETVASVSASLGDSVLTGLAGLLAYGRAGEPAVTLNEIVRNLEQERVDLDLEVLLKRIGEYQSGHGKRPLPMGVLLDACEAAIEREAILELTSLLEVMREQIKTDGYSVEELDRRLGRVIERLIHFGFGPRGTNIIIASKVLQFANDVGISATFRRGVWNWSERSMYSPWMFDAVRRDPGFGVEYLLLALEFGHPPDIRDLMRKLSPGWLAAALRENPKSGLKFIRLAKRVADLRTDDAFFDKLLVEALQPSSLAEILRRDPRAAAEVLKLANTALGPRWADGLGYSLFEQLFESALDPRWLAGLIARDPEAVLEVWRLATEYGGARWQERVARLLFDELPPWQLSDIMAKAEAARKLLQLARDTGDPMWRERLRRGMPSVS